MASNKRVILEEFRKLTHTERLEVLARMLPPPPRRRVRLYKPIPYSSSVRSLFAPDDEDGDDSELNKTKKKRKKKKKRDKE